MLHLGYPEDLLPILQEGERLSKELDDKRSLVMIYGRMGSYFAYIGKPLIGMKYAESAFEEARRTRDIDLMVPAAFELCVPTMTAGEFHKTVDIAVSALNLIEQTNRESDFFGQSMNVYSALCGRCGGSMSYLGNFHEAEAVLEKGLYNATAIGDLRALALVELYFGHMFWAKGAWERAKEHYELCIKYGQEMKLLMALSLAWSGLGHACSFLGDQVTAAKNIEKGLKIQLDAGIEWWLSAIYVLLSAVRFNSGDLKSALGFIEKALQLSQKNSEKYMEGESWIWMGRIVGRSDPSRKDEAEQNILRGINILEKMELKPFYTLGRFFLGEFYLNAGQREKAAKNLKKANGMFQEMGMDYWLARTKEAMERL
jgi:tetratricopeptide (TPR) repeat protein